MAQRWKVAVRWAAPILGGGLLLQTGGCAIDPALLVEGLFLTAINELVTQAVFGLFNAPALLF